MTALEFSQFKTSDPIGKCSICERAFLRTKSQRDKCSDCKYARTKLAQRICRTCEQSFAPRGPLQKWCSNECRFPAAGVAKPCPTCGTAITDKWGSNCDTCAAETRRRKRRNERARHKGCEREPYAVTEIFERDQHTCQLCGKAARMDTTVPHPLAPTIDHIIPISQGGSDTRVNVQLAHFSCNVAKGTGGSQQLRMLA